MSFIYNYITSPKEGKKKIKLPPTDDESEDNADSSKEWKKTDSPTTSDVDTDAVINDSDYGELYANEVSASEKAHYRRQAMKKLKAKGVRRKRKKKSALADESEDALKERIRLLSAELTRRGSAAKTDDDDSIIPPPKRKEPEEDKKNDEPIEKPIEKPIEFTFDSELITLT